MIAPAAWARLRRVLAVRPDNTGDVVMLEPALAAIREMAPAAEITLLASPAGARAVPLVSSVAATLTWRTSWQDASAQPAADPAQDAQLIERLRDGGFDAAFIFTSFSQTPFAPGYACHLAGIPVRAGQSDLFGGAILTHQVPASTADVHQTERNLHLVERLGATVRRRSISLAIPADAEARAEQLLGEAIGEHGFIAVFPGASAAARRYPARRFGAAARLVAEESGEAVVIVGGEREGDLCDAAMAELDGVRAVCLAGRTGVSEAAAIVSRARLVLANNSLGMHLAEAFNVPSVVPYSGTDLRSQWRPRFTAARLLGVHTACTPCYRFECPYALECLDIPPEALATAAADVMRRSAELAL